ncbi:MAG: HupE/UreJ family protein [Acidimicrobiales bacterium]|nr:HupE/UreJ family protein [Acidimicrobiales bacterium]
MSDRLRPLLLLAAGVIALLTVFASPAAAHSGEQSYVYFDIYDGRMAGRVEFVIRDLNQATGLDIPEDEAGATAAVEADLETIRTYATDHLSVGDESGTETWPVVFGDDFEIISLAAGSYVVVPFEVDHAFESVPGRFTVTWDGIIEAIPERDALLLIGNDWEAGVFNEEANQLLRFTSGNTTQVVDRDASFLKGFGTVIALGTEHIEIGTDHILFVLALVVPAVLVFTRGEGWRPTPSFGSGLWRVTKIATMFTLAHSVTLSLGGLGILELPPRPVETFIALSIALAAVHNFYPVFVNKEWVLAFLFGLAHGLGFAGVLNELGLGDNNRFWTLLGFNIGIELGQLVIIFLVFPVLFLLRRTRLYPAVLYGASAALALAALGWAGERALDLPERVNTVVDPVLAWPRAAWIVVLTGVFAAIYNRWEASRGLLRSNDDLLPGPAFQRHLPERHRADSEPEPDDDGPTGRTVELEPAG